MPVFYEGLSFLSFCLFSSLASDMANGGVLVVEFRCSSSSSSSAVVGVMSLIVGWAALGGLWLGDAAPQL